MTNRITLRLLILRCISNSKRMHCTESFLFFSSILSAVHEESNFILLKHKFSRVENSIVFLK